MRPTQGKDAYSTTSDRRHLFHTCHQGRTRSNHIVHQQKMLILPLFWIAHPKNILHIVLALLKLRARLMGIIARADKMLCINGYMQHLAQSLAYPLRLIESAFAQTTGVQRHWHQAINIVKQVRINIRLRRQSP